MGSFKDGRAWNGTLHFSYLEQMAHYIGLGREVQKFLLPLEPFVTGRILQQTSFAADPHKKNQRCSSVNPGSWYATAWGTERDRLHRRQCESVDRTSEQDMV